MVEKKTKVCKEIHLRGREKDTWQPKTELSVIEIMNGSAYLPLYERNYQYMYIQKNIKQIALNTI